MVQTTSKEAYKDIQPTIGRKQSMILEVFKKAKREVSNREIAKYLGLEINCVTPRVNELVKMGYVYAYNKRVCRVGGRKSIHWKLYKDRQ